MSRASHPLLLVALLAAAPAAYAVQVGPAGEAGSVPAVTLGAPASGVEFRLDAPQIDAGYDAAQKQYQADLDAIAALPAGQRDFPNTIQAFEQAGARFAERIQPLIFLSQVSTDPAARDAAQKLEVRAGEFNTVVMARMDLYEAIKEAAGRASGMSEQDARLAKRTLSAFDNSGPGLTAEQKASFKKISDRLSQISSEFEKNVNDDNTMFEAKPEDLKGVPQAYVNGLEKTADGKVRIALTEPDMLQVMRFADDSETRHRYELAYNRRAADKNDPLLAEMLDLRDQQARLLGRASYPDLALEDRMAEKPQRVWDFLNGLLPTLRGRGIKELSDLLALKRRFEPDATRVNSWDLRYLGEKTRQERYGVDSEALKKYFPMDRVVDGTMRVYERILGVKFTEVPSPEKWHEDVKLFRIDDAATGAEIGYFYLDLYPREGKYTHGAMFPIISGRELEQGGYRKPVGAMVVNFLKGKNGEPTLVPLEDVETFFHEFGHLMHHTLTKARYASMAGTNTALDFVEAPSQMLENFVWEREVLDEISGHVDDPSRKIPDDLYQKLTAMRRYNLYGGALFYLRQLAFALIDMTYHAAVPRELSRLFNQTMETVWMMPTDPQTRFEASFDHLASAYGAGYYAYLWSEVFADDIFTRFKKEGLFNSAVGTAWRREVLEQGSSRPEIDSLRAFLGREPSDAAFRAKIEGPKPPTAAELAAYSQAHEDEMIRALRVPGVVAIRPESDDQGLFWKVLADFRRGEESIRGAMERILPGRVVLHGVKPVGAGI